MDVESEANGIDHSDIDGPLLRNLRNGMAFRIQGGEYLLAAGGLPLAWERHSPSLRNQHDVEELLCKMSLDGKSMADLRRMHGREFGHSSHLTDSLVIKQMARAVSTKRAHIMKKKKTNPLVSKTDPQVYIDINTTLGTKILFDKLSQYEGGQYLVGYIPHSSKTKIVIDNSGMTIATGFDLGQYDLKTLQSWGFSEDLQSRLKAFLGHPFKGQTVKEVQLWQLHQGAPTPTITTPEANQIDTATHTSILKTTIANWNSAVKAKSVPQFVGLPAAWQTVLFSRTFQEGGGMPHKKMSKPFYDAARKGLWKEAAALLKDGSDKYKERLSAEAALLLSDLPPDLPSAPVNIMPPR